MKLQKFFTTFALTGFLMAGALVSLGSAQKSREVKATDVGEVAIEEIYITKDTINPNAFYLLPVDAVEGLTTDWGVAYTAAAEDEGIFINGVKQATALIKYVQYESATFYCELGKNAVDGDEIEVRGTFSKGSNSFAINYVVERFGNTWVNDLEDYDVISLKDANMPDFEYVAINTEDAAGYGYIAYDKDNPHYAKKYIPKRKGIFGYTNETQSFAFEFNFEVNGTMSSWFEVRIGASGGWDVGHYLHFALGNQWNEGVVIGKECVDGAVCGTNTKEVRSDISDGERLLSMGSIKLKGSENKYFVFFKNNGVVALGEYWDLASTYRSTKVSIYHNQADVKITNAVTPVENKFNLSTSSTASAIYFNTEKDVLPFVNSWADYFIPQSADGFTYNGEDASVDKLNYFKKVGATVNAFFLGFGDLGITPATGDMFHLGGIFKMARYKGEEKITVVYKVVIEDCDFQFDGEAWHAINPNYEASDFAKDLLKLTLPVCSASDDNNHDALVIVWATLADANHYDALVIDEKETLADAEGDKTIVVPSTVEGIEEMLPVEAIGAAMYRYDVLTAKYSLSNFIDGRPDVPNSSSYYNNVITTNESNNIFIIVAIISVVSISLLSVLIIKKRKQK